MALSSIVAIYFLFFAFSAFLLLPFGVRTDEEAGTPKVAGQADSAPHRFDLKRHLLRAALLGAFLFALYYANWTFGWIKPDDLDFYHRF
jgi:predicted secreted protein